MRTRNASTAITEVLPTSTLHRGTTLSPLHPKLALGTLFKLGSLRHLHEGLIFRTHAHKVTVLLTTHAFVVVAPALQTVASAAPFAVKQGYPHAIFVNQVAVRGGTPRSAIPVFLHVFIKGVIVVFLFQLWSHKITEFLMTDFNAAFFVGTLDSGLPTLNGGFDVLVEAIDVENVLTLKREHVFGREVHSTDLAFLKHVRVGLIRLVETMEEVGRVGHDLPCEVFHIFPIGFDLLILRRFALLGNLLDGVQDNADAVGTVYAATVHETLKHVNLLQDRRDARVVEGQVETSERVALQPHQQFPHGISLCHLAKGV